MRAIPEDLKKIHQKYAELAKEQGQEFAQGFLTYMVEVDYHQGAPEPVLRRLLWTWHADKFAHEIEDLLTQQVASDLVNGFAFAQAYSQQTQYRYGAG